VKRQVADLLDIADPSLISLPGRPGDIGLGSTFRMPFVTIESVLPLEDHRLLVINDYNYPFSAGRNATRPDDSEFVILRLPED
jgi:glycerophosphoryl diester phosphodiesterase